MTNDGRTAMEVRQLAQERIVDALLRALAIEQPNLLQTVRTILVDTEFTHSGKPGIDQTLHQQIQQRMVAAATFVTDHGG